MNKIYELKTYTDNVGKSVVKLEATTGNSYEFIGSAVIVQGEKKIPVRFPFPKEIATVSACFENFDNCLKSFIEANATKEEKPLSSKSAEENVKMGKILKFPSQK